MTQRIKKNCVALVSWEPDLKRAYIKAEPSETERAKDKTESETEQNQQPTIDQ